MNCKYSRMGTGLSLISSQCNTPLSCSSRIVLSILIAGLELKVMECNGCAQNDNDSRLTCEDSLVMFQCATGLHDSSDLWINFRNLKTNRTAYCRPNQWREELHHGWVLHRKTENYDCVLKILKCGYEDAGDYRCEFFIPDKHNGYSRIESDARSVVVQSTGPQHETWFELKSMGIGMGAIGLIALVIVGLVIIGFIKKRRIRGEDHQRSKLIITSYSQG